MAGPDTSKGVWGIRGRRPSVPSLPAPLPGNTAQRQIHPGQQPLPPQANPGILPPQLWDLSSLATAQGSEGPCGRGTLAMAGAGGPESPSTPLASLRLWLLSCEDQPQAAWPPQGRKNT